MDPPRHISGEKGDIHLYSNNFGSSSFRGRRSFSFLINMDVLFSSPLARTTLFHGGSYSRFVKKCLSWADVTYFGERRFAGHDTFSPPLFREKVVLQCNTLESCCTFHCLRAIQTSVAPRGPPAARRVPSWLNATTTTSAPLYSGLLSLSLLLPISTSLRHNDLRHEEHRDNPFGKLS